MDLRARSQLVASSSDSPSPVTSARDDVSRETLRPLPPWAEVARPGLLAYADLLASAGVERGLIGPREVPRLWDRHILNCLVVADPNLDLVPTSAVVADVGSGAGLPGVVWALARPDIRMVLVEPLLRRSEFLSEAVDRVGLADRVAVVRGRAEDLGRNAEWAGVDVVTARAVAPLSKLLGWTIPLAKPGGRLVALKGESAQAEVDAALQTGGSTGVAGLAVTQCGQGVVDPATVVVVGERVS